MNILSTLNTLFDPLAAGGAWPLLAGQGIAKPYIVYSRIGSGVLNVVEGPPPLDNVHLQVDVYATTYAEADAIAQSVTDTLQASAQVATFGCYATTSPRDLFEPDTRLYRVLMEFSVWSL